jgi:hypothetical protein
MSSFLGLVGLGLGLKKFKSDDGASAAQQYLEWRKGSLIVAMSMWAIAIMMQGTNLPTQLAAYQKSLLSLPSGVADHSDGLAAFMFYSDVGLFTISAFCLLSTALSYRDQMAGNVAASNKRLTKTWAVFTTVCK